MKQLFYIVLLGWKTLTYINQIDVGLTKPTERSSHNGQQWRVSLLVCKRKERAIESCQGDYTRDVFIRTHVFNG